MQQLAIWGPPVATVLFFVFLGLRSGRDMDAAEDRFLSGGKGFGPVVLALSIFATSNTGFMFVGAVGAGFTQGIAALWVPVAWCVGETIFWLSFPKRIHAIAEDRKPLSIPDYIRKGVSEHHRPVQIAAGIVIVFATFPYIIGQNIAAGKAVAAIAEIPTQTSVLIAGGIVTSVALLYCSRGGLRSSMIANTAQGAFILTVSLIIAALAAADAVSKPGVLEAILSVNPNAFDPFALHPLFLVMVSFLGAATASFGSAMSLPTLLMRVTAAKGEAELKKARFWYLFICYGFWMAMTGLGLLLSGLVGDVSDPEQALFIFAGSMSPLLTGFAISGISALILSTIDGSMIVGGSALSDDLAQAQYKQPAVTRMLRIGGLVVFSGTALLIAVILAEASVYDIVLFGVSALAGGIGPAFMITTLKWPTSSAALVSAITLGAVTSTVWAALGLSDYVSEALPAFAVGLGVHWCVVKVSRSAPQPEFDAIDQA